MEDIEESLIETIACFVTAALLIVIGLIVKKIKNKNNNAMRMPKNIVKGYPKKIDVILTKEEIEDFTNIEIQCRIDRISLRDVNELFYDAARFTVNYSTISSKSIDLHLSRLNRKEYDYYGGHYRNEAWSIQKQLIAAKIIGKDEKRIFEDNKSLETYLTKLKYFYDCVFPLKREYIDEKVNEIFKQQKIDEEARLQREKERLKQKWIDEEVRLQKEQEDLEQEEREAIRLKILEKQRIKELEKQIKSEMIDKGIISNSKSERREPIPQDIQDRVWNRDGGQCVKCGSKENLEFDHIIPFSKGGATSYRNLQLLCENCNRSKSNKIGTEDDN
jgi:hypothetical protein